MDFSIETLIITLLSISVFLLVLSFLQKDRMKELENQVESLTMQMMKENYKFKKRITLLEEELLGVEVNMENDLKNQQEILNLLKRGNPTD